MKQQTLLILALAGPAAVALSVGVAAAHGSVPDSEPNDAQTTQLISGSALLAGLEAGALFPFLDTTPTHIEHTHIAVTDSTESCAAGAAPPANIQILVGEAGVALTNVMTAATNTGIGTPQQCVFHVTAQPGQQDVPETVTDVVVVNAGDTALTGINTVTASASVAGAR